MTPLLRLAAGAGAGIVGMSATYPLDMVRGRLTVQSMEGTHRYRGIMHAAAVIVKEVSPFHMSPGLLRCNETFLHWTMVPMKEQGCPDTFQIFEWLAANFVDV